MRFLLSEIDGGIGLLADGDVNGGKSFAPIVIRPGESFMGRVPYDLLRNFTPGMVDISPETFVVTRAKMEHGGA